MIRVSQDSNLVLFVCTLPHSFLSGKLLILLLLPIYQVLSLGLTHVTVSPGSQCRRVQKVQVQVKALLGYR